MFCIVFVYYYIIQNKEKNTYQLNKIDVKSLPAATLNTNDFNDTLNIDVNIDINVIKSVRP